MFSCPAANPQPGLRAARSGSYPRQVCQLCAPTSPSIDEDMRAGEIQAKVKFGPVSIGAVVNESLISEYRLYLFDDVEGPRLGGPVDIVLPRTSIDTPECCSPDKYTAQITVTLPGQRQGFDRLFVGIFIVVDGLELPTEFGWITISDQAPSPGNAVASNVAAGCLTFDQAASSLVGSNDAALAARKAIAEAAGLPLSQVNGSFRHASEACGAAPGTTRRLNGQGVVLLEYTVKVAEGGLDINQVTGAMRTMGTTQLVAKIEANMQAAGLPASLTFLSAELPDVVPLVAKEDEVWASDCDDAPGEWRSPSGLSCDDYIARKYCLPDGSYGTGWGTGGELFSAFADSDGIDASQACCGCGGGQPTQVLSSIPFAVLNETHCTAQLPYRFLTGGGQIDPNGTAVLNTGLGDMLHRRWVQTIASEDLYGAREELSIVWRFRSTKSLRRRFADAAAEGEPVDWHVTWRGGAWRKSGIWNFVSGNRAVIPNHWLRDTSGLQSVSEYGSWGAASDRSDGSGSRPTDFIGLGRFPVDLLAPQVSTECGVVCFPLGSASDCHAQRAVHSVLSTVVEADICSSQMCASAGMVLQGVERLPALCAGKQCTVEECCTGDGTCESVSCSSYGLMSNGLPKYMPVSEPPEFYAECANESCQVDACCELSPDFVENAGGAANTETIMFIVLALTACGAVIWVVLHRRKFELYRRFSGDDKPPQRKQAQWQVAPDTKQEEKLDFLKVVPSEISQQPPDAAPRAPGRKQMPSAPPPPPPLPPPALGPLPGEEGAATAAQRSVDDQTAPPPGVPQEP